MKRTAEKELTSENWLKPDSDDDELSGMEQPKTIAPEKRVIKQPVSRLKKQMSQPVASPVSVPSSNPFSNFAFTPANTVPLPSQQPISQPVQKKDKLVYALNSAFCEYIIKYAKHDGFLNANLSPLLEQYKKFYEETLKQGENISPNQGNGFGFGASLPEKKSGEKEMKVSEPKGFGFGAPKTESPATSTQAQGFSFGASKSKSTATSTQAQGFSFGAPKTEFPTTTTPASGFNSGVPKSDSLPTTTQAPGFSFGAPKIDSTVNAAAPGFNFGAPKAEIVSGFSFGAPKTVSPASTGSFSFGAPKAEETKIEEKKPEIPKEVQVKDEEMKESEEPKKESGFKFSPTAVSFQPAEEKSDKFKSPMTPAFKFGETKSSLDTPESTPKPALGFGAAAVMATPGVGFKFGVKPKTEEPSEEPKTKEEPKNVPPSTPGFGFQFAKTPETPVVESGFKFAPLNFGTTEKKSEDVKEKPKDENKSEVKKPFAIKPFEFGSGSSISPTGSTSPESKVPPSIAASVFSSSFKFGQSDSNASAFSNSGFKFGTVSNEPATEKKLEPASAFGSFGPPSTPFQFAGQKPEMTAVPVTTAAPTSFQFGSTTNEGNKPFAFTFGNNNSAIGTPLPFSFAPSAATEMIKEEDEEGGPAEEVPVEVLQETEKEEMKTGAGEEGDETLKEFICKLFKFKEGNYSELGKHYFKINRQLKSQKCRILCRNVSSGKISLNIWITNQIMISKIKEKNMNLIVPELKDGEVSMQKYLVRVGDDSICEQLENAVKENISKE